ncbi:MBL fold metallo-hydrolase [Pseudofulvibacter geojedonensis]|uniref:MBL fold metallo-hydrolase n=1 Tax=Pseudofulvibacter geojedonensis TaxID=1123758 RepID=A0ABW3HYT3_9FLAO
MKLTFLGTGTSQGIPVIGSTHPVCLSNDFKDKRLRSSVLITTAGKNIVIDCGPDFRQQMLRVNPKTVDAILFTHEHSDHTAGLDDIRPFCFRQGDIQLYGEANVFQSLQQRFAYIFETQNRYPGAPTVAMNTINENEKFLVANNTEVIPIRVMHDKLPILGFRIGKVAYLTDAKIVSDTEIEKLLGVEVLVVNALREEEHASHFTLSEALNFVEKVKPKKAYLTHISHLLGFHEEVEENLPKNVFLGYDNLTIEI